MQNCTDTLLGNRGQLPRNPHGLMQSAPIDLTPFLGSKEPAKSNIKVA